jgi:hypothetical protein
MGFGVLAPSPPGNIMSEPEAPFIIWYCFTASKVSGPISTVLLVDFFASMKTSLWPFSCNLAFMILSKGTSTTSCMRAAISYSNRTRAYSSEEFYFAMSNKLSICSRENAWWGLTPTRPLVENPLNVICRPRHSFK